MNYKWTGSVLWYIAEKVTSKQNFMKNIVVLIYSVKENMIPLSLKHNFIKKLILTEKMF